MVDSLEIIGSMQSKMEKVNERLVNFDENLDK